MRLTLERVVTDPAELRRELVARLGTAPVSLAIDEVDWVRETTTVRARVPVDDDMLASVEDPADDALTDSEEDIDARR